MGHPMSHLMSLNNPLLSRSGMLPGLPAGLPGLPGLPALHGGNAQALLDSYKQSYGDMIKHLHGSVSVLTILLKRLNCFYHIFLIQNYFDH